jgi:AcrR family transcriptional regulator
VTDGRSERSVLSRAKLLDAAREEFQRNGFAGGRVDAIAELAGVNKRMIYAYYGSKAGLFDAVLADNVARVAAAVTFTPDDLPDYAVRLFDFWTADTTSLRLFSWRNVELSSAPAFEDSTYRAMIDEIATVSGAGSSQLPPAHVLAFVFALVLAWVIPADVFQHPDAVEHAERRRSVRWAVGRLLDAPLTAGI